MKAGSEISGPMSIVKITCSLLHAGQTSRVCSAVSEVAGLAFFLAVRVIFTTDIEDVRWWYVRWRTPTVPMSSCAWSTAKGGRTCTSGRSLPDASRRSNRALIIESTPTMIILTSASSASCVKEEGAGVNDAFNLAVFRPHLAAILIYLPVVDGLPLPLRAVDRFCSSLASVIAICVWRAVFHLTLEFSPKLSLTLGWIGIHRPRPHFLLGTSPLPIYYNTAFLSVFAIRRRHKVNTALLGQLPGNTEA